MGRAIASPATELRSPGDVGNESNHYAPWGSDRSGIIEKTIAFPVSELRSLGILWKTMGGVIALPATELRSLGDVGNDLLVMFKVKYYSAMIHLASLCKWVWQELI